MQRIFNCDVSQDITLTSDIVLSSLVYLLPFCVIIYTSYTFLNNARFSMAHCVYW